MLPMAVAAAFLLSGCVEAITDTVAGPTRGQDEESFAEFLDVPYPANMSFSKKQSFTYERRGVQSGLVTVSGRMNMDELGAYYDAHLPGHGWSPVAEVQYSSAFASTWRKGEKLLTIVSRPASFSVGGDVTVELWVAPPHTQADLGHRVVYQKPSAQEEGESSSGGGFLDGLFGGPKKSGDGAKGSTHGAVTEEDI